MKILVLILNIIIYLILTSSLIASNTPIISKEPKIIDSKNLVLEFSKHKNQYVFLKDLRLKEQRGLIEVPDSSIEAWKVCPLWSLTFIDPNISINSNSADYVSTDTGENETSMWISHKWSYSKNNLALTIFVKIQIDAFTSSSLWDLEIISQRDQKFELEKVVFPIVGDIKLSGEEGNIRLVYPQSWGYEYFRAEDHDISYDYPSSGCQMQFVAYYNDKTREGIYVSSSDTDGNQKIYRNHQGNPDIPFARFEPTLLPSPEKGLNWKTPYSTVLRPYNGDWYEPAKFYRDWVISNSPSVKANRDKICKWLFETNFWFRSGPSSSTESNFQNTENLKYLEIVTDYLGVNTAVNLFHWHKYQFDYLYPDYFPARSGMLDFIQEMKRSEIKIVPYINGRIIDERLLESNVQYDRSVCLFDTSRTPPYLVSIYHDSPFVTMCPSAKPWQDKIFSISKTVVENYKVDGIYFDQICNNNGFRCLSTQHGHIPDPNFGGNIPRGNRWVKGYKSMLEKIAELKKSNSEIIFSSEDAAEPWNNLIDLFLMFNSRSTDENNSYQMVPLYPSVYSGYTTTMGFQYIGMDPKDWTPVILSKLARALVWGSQPGWIEAKTVYENKIILEYTKNLVKTRKLAQDYLNFGEMKRTPVFNPPLLPEVVEEWVRLEKGPGRITFTLSPIQTSYWELNNNSGAIILTNFTENKYDRQNQMLMVFIDEIYSEKENFDLFINGTFGGDAKAEHNKIQIPIIMGAYESKFIEIVPVDKI